jgi:hypothetical protein
MQLRHHMEHNKEAQLYRRLSNEMRLMTPLRMLHSWSHTILNPWRETSLVKVGLWIFGLEFNGGEPRFQFYATTW